MAEVAEFYSLDLLHVHYAIPHSVSALLARQMLAIPRLSLPFITTLHGTDITLVGLDRSYLPITKFGIEQSDGVTAISTYLRDRTHKAFHIDTEIEVIRNFVNCDVYVRNPELVAAMRPRFAEPNERLLVHLSNFRPVKRVQDVVKVFARVAKAMPARLLLIGDGPDRSVAEYLAREHDVSGPHPLSRQAGQRQRTPSPRRPHAHAQRDGVLRPRRPRSHGLQRPLHRHPCRRSPRAHQRRPQRSALRSRRHRNHVQAAISLLSDDHLETMARAARKTAQDHFCASRVIPLYEDYYDRVIARTQPNLTNLSHPSPHFSTASSPLPETRIFPNPRTLPPRHSPHRILHQPDRLIRRAPTKPQDSAPASKTGINSVTRVPLPGLLLISTTASFPYKTSIRSRTFRTPIPVPGLTSPLVGEASSCSGAIPTPSSSTSTINCPLL